MKEKQKYILKVTHTLSSAGITMIFPPGTVVEVEWEVSKDQPLTQISPQPTADEIMSRAIARSLENHG
jgi:hypothetical protein